MKKEKLITKGLLIGLIIWLFPMVAGYTQTSGTLSGASMGIDTGVGARYAAGGREAAAHTHECTSEVEKQKLEGERQRIEPKKGTLELEKAMDNSSH
ncbi:MAG: hypothetical protein LBC30_00840 [Puniceicoccales bacterium]|nr:hypothetical protein [Puniceicoccales bacterium]